MTHDDTTANARAAGNSKTRALDATSGPEARRDAEPRHDPGGSSGPQEAIGPLNLAGRMDDWGPWGANEGQWLLFTIGNPEEGHGAALPRMIDDLHAKNLAYQVEFRTGARYVAHVPFTTDRCGPVARDWAPRYLPEGEAFDRTVAFLRYHVELLRELGLPARRALLIVGHGGNAIFLEREAALREALELEAMRVVSAFGILQAASADGTGRAFEVIERLARARAGPGEDPDDLAFQYFQLLASAGHASHMEHTLAAAMGACDRAKLARQNQALAEDFEDALARWPPLGGLGGYLLAGGKYTAALGTRAHDKYGLWHCLDGLRMLHGGQVHVDEALGKALLAAVVDELCAIVTGTLPPA